MLKFMYKCRGSVSVFLILVLLPMLTVAGIFVDISRVRMGKAVVETASDLALNAALSQYDNMVKDIYGLFTTSQDINEIYDKLEEYYKKAIMEQGIGEDDASLYVQQIMGTYFKSSESGSDNLLGIKTNDFELTPVENSYLINPAIMKSQIVEFMKYRAPIEGGLSLLEGIKTIGNVQKQMEVVESKNNYYKKKEELVDNLGKAWSRIREYQYRHINSYPESAPVSGHGFPSETYYVKEQIDVLNNYKTGLESLYSSMLYYYQYGRTLGDTLTGTDSFRLNEAFKLIESGGNWSAVVGSSLYTISDSYTEVTVTGKDENKYHPVNTDNPGGNKEWKSGDTYIIKWALNGITHKYDKYDYMSDLGLSASSQSNAGEVAEGLIKEYFLLEDEIRNSESYKLMSTLNVNDSLAYKMYVLYVFVTDVREKGTKSYPMLIAQMTSTLCKMKNLWSYVSDADNPVHAAIENSMKSRSCRGTNTWELIQSLKDKLSMDVSSSEYLPFYNSYVNTLSDLLDSQIRPEYESKITGSFGAINTLSKAGNTMLAIDRLIEKKKGNLNEAKSLLEAARQTSSECDTKRDEWSQKTEKLDADDTLGASNKTEINREKESVSTDMIQSMITRIDHALETLNALDNKLDEYKIAGVYWWQLADDAGGNRIDIEKFYMLIKSGIDTLGMSEQYKAVPKNGNEYDAIKQALLGNAAYNVTASTPYAAADGEHALDLTYEQRSLYAWMYNNFGGDKLPADEGGETSETNIKGKADDAKNSEKNEITKVKGSITSAKDSQVEKTPVDTSKFSTSDAKLPSNILTELKEKRGEDNTDNKKELDSSDETDQDKMMKSATGSDEGGGITGMFGDLIDIVSGKAAALVDTLRDEIYISTYIMNNFSYKTLEAELIDKYNNKKGASLDVKAIYTPSGDSYVADTAYSEVVKEARTLTNFPINPDNNYLYGSEIEYMIYGDPNKDAFGTIYIIRFACNTVYAFMNPEINEYTLSAATALFGTPPLTPLIPIAKIAFTIAWSLAESGVDIYLLKQGQAVPLMKNASTWVLLPGNIAEFLGGEIGTYVKSKVKDGINSVISAGAEQLNNWTKMTDEELQKLIDEYTSAADKEVTEIGSYINSLTQSYTDQINLYAHQAIEEYVNICNSVKQRVSAVPSGSYTAEELQKLSEGEQLFYNIACDGEITDAEIAELIEFELNEWLNRQAENGKENAIYEAKEIAVNVLLQRASDDIIYEYTTITASEMSETVDEIKEKIDNILAKRVKDVSDKIKETIDLNLGYISKGKNNIVKKVTDAIDNGADKLKEYASNGVDKAFDGIQNLFSDGTISGADGNGKGTAQSLYANLLSWRYSDYLTLFLLVNLFANDAKVLSRMADIMQTNIVNMPGGNEKFLFSNTYTYMSLTTEAEVKPLLSAGLLSNLGIDNTASDWYKIKYTNILGY